MYLASLLITVPASYYDSLSAMLETDISAYENGVFNYDPQDGWLEVNVKRYRKPLRIKINRLLMIQVCKKFREVISAKFDGVGIKIG